MILVTGGTGFFGRHLVPRLLADGRQVRVLSRSPGRVPLPQGVAWAQGDLLDAPSLVSALQDVETVIHAGAVLGAVAGGAEFERVNAGGTANLARAAREAGIRRFIHVSSGGVYGDGATASPHLETDAPAPATAYERSKLAAERALLDALAGSNTSWAILRPQGLYGSSRPATIALFRDVARRRLWLHGPARVVVHPTHVDDLANACALVLDREKLDAEVINVGGERALEYPELIALIGARLGRVPLQLRAPRWVARAAALAGGSGGRLARLSREWITRAVDIEKARRVLGFAPVALEPSLDRIASDLRERGLLQ